MTTKTRSEGALRPVRDGETVSSVQRRASSGRRLERFAVIGAFVCAAALTASLFALAILPTQTWRNERDAVLSTQDNIDELEAEENQLQRRADALETDSGVAAEARDQYRLVDPNEDTFVFSGPLLASDDEDGAGQTSEP